MTTQSSAPSGELTIRIVAMPADTNSNGDIFGGWLVSHMDLAGGCEATRHAKSRTVTVAINEMEFILPVAVGDIVSCYTKLLKIGRTSLQIQIESWKVSRQNDNLHKVAQGIFTYVAIDDNRLPRPVGSNL